MIEKILTEKIRDYAPANAVEQEHVLQELMQHFVLVSLSRTDFFSRAAFHGGSCLRIFHGTHRFSHDLDFLLKEPIPDFHWAPYLEQIQRDCRQEGIEFEAQDRSKVEVAVRKAFLKADSIGQEWTLRLPFPRHATRKLKILLEIDSNPPAGSTFATRYLTFPATAAVTTQALPSGFATKSHALLCRSFIKGRDWYDFLWYVAKGVTPDLALLGKALDQMGPWAETNPVVTTDWYLDTMRHKIEEIDWEVAKQDVARFLSAREQEGLKLWGRDLFLDLLERLAQLV